MGRSGARSSGGDDEEWAGSGVDFVQPQDFEYGKREGSHQDPDGNLIRFGLALRS